jgi:hypothetical protein
VAELASLAGVPLRAPPSAEELEAEILRALRDPESRAAIGSFVEPALPLVEVELPGNGFGGIMGRTVLAYAEKRGLRAGEIRDLGLRAAISVPNPRGKVALWGPWLVFPVLDGGRVVGWQARRTGKGDPRFVASDHTDGWLWPQPVVGACERVVLVEGLFDALGAARLGHRAHACFGRSVSAAQAWALCRVGVREVVLAFDPDTAGDRCGRRGWSSVERAVAALRGRFRVLVADLSRPPDLGGGAKADLGEALRSEEAARWGREALVEPMDIEAPGWTEWLARAAMGGQ